MLADWVFLDRDGTLNVSPPAHQYVTDPDELVLLPTAAEAVGRLNRAGVWVGVVTNQRGVGLGRMTMEQLDAVHERLGLLLRERGARVDGIWVCPHLEGACDCRKPKPGLLLAAQRAVPGIDFDRAAMIGDSATDVAAGAALGLTTIRLGDRREDAAFAAPNLDAAVELLLAAT